MEFPFKAEVVKIRKRGRLIRIQRRWVKNERWRAPKGILVIKPIPATPEFRAAWAACLAGAGTPQPLLQPAPPRPPRRSSR